MVDEHVNNPKSPKYHVKRWLYEIRDEIKGKTVLDIPAGNGVTSEILLELGCKVEAFDLFPEYFLVKEIECRKADINKQIPVPDEHADFVICQEGIEHFSDQVNAFSEFNRVLRKGGKLVITTPSYSSIAARLSYALFETESFNKQMPPNEIDSIWLGDNKDKKVYYGHIFLLGLQKMRVIARLTGFKISRINFMRIHKTSAFLFPFAYPFIYLSSWFTYYKSMRKNRALNEEQKRKTYLEQLKINISPKVLVDRHSFIIFEKEYSTDEVYPQMAAMSKQIDKIL